MEKIERIEKQVMEDRLQEALKSLLEIFKMQKQDELTNEVLLVMGRLSGYEKK